MIVVDLNHRALTEVHLDTPDGTLCGSVAATLGDWTWDPDKVTCERCRALIQQSDLMSGRDGDA
jgi:hypothetical protein